MQRQFRLPLFAPSLFAAVTPSCVFVGSRLGLSESRAWLEWKMEIWKEKKMSRKLQEALSPFYYYIRLRKWEPGNGIFMGSAVRENDFLLKARKAHKSGG